MNPRTIHFEIPAKDPHKLAAFYQAAFGWHVSKWNGPPDYWSVVMGPNGASESLSSMSANTVEVDDIDAYITKIMNSGGAIVEPKMAITGVGWMTYVTDVEGNVFGMMQPDKSAKADQPK